MLLDKGFLKAFEGCIKCQVLHGILGSTGILKIISVDLNISVDLLF